ncbi:MAG: hypothetical protein WCP19_15370 [Chloroflexota bacterium]
MPRQVELALTACLGTGADGMMNIRLPVIAQLVVIHTRDFDGDVDAVEKRIRNAFLVSRHCRGCEGAGFGESP